MTKRVQDLKAGDRTKWYLVASDVEPLTDDPGTIGCAVVYEDGGSSHRVWPADTKVEVEVS